jgi:hypothetical protein
MGLGQPFYIPNMQKSALNIWVWVLPFLIVNMQKSLLNLRRLSAAFLYCQYSEICIHYKKTLKNSEGAIKNGQSRENANIGYTRPRQTKQTHNKICVGHHYAQQAQIT